MSFPNDAEVKREGIDVWRIEKMEPKKVAKTDHGKLFSGDCYIIAVTKIIANKKIIDLFFWLGKDSSQDEQGAVAYHTVALDDHMNAKAGADPTQHREVQGHESPEFLAVFPSLQYLDGGVDSAFRHVERDKYEPRLFQCKGKRHIRVQQVALSRTSLNEGDVFILDLGLTLIQWNGREANKYEKAKALNVLTGIKNDERGGRAKIIILDSGGDDDRFWGPLGGKGAVKSAAEGGDDDTHGADTPAVLFRISDASGSMQVQEEGRAPNLKRDQLDTNDAFIVDTGSQVYVWCGRGSNKQERAKSMEVAAKFLRDNKRPDWTPVTKVMEGGESGAFKAQFSVWDKPLTKQERAAKQRGPDNIDALFASRAQAEAEKMETIEGKVEVWRIEDFDKQPVHPSLYGQFFGGDSYIVLFSYKRSNGRPAWIVYFWQGAKSSNDEKGASALLAKQLDDEVAGGEATQVRVVQGKEPGHFVSLFKGTMVVHEGGRASSFKNRADVDSYDTDGINLFHVKGSKPSNTRAVQVPEAASSLNSGDCFVLRTPSHCYAWLGSGSNDTERNTARSVAASLAGTRSKVDVAEGQESDEFWAALGGKGEYPTAVADEDDAHAPRLFHCTTNTRNGGFGIKEIPSFTQDDLCNDDVMLLDTFKEVFVWVGTESSKEEQDKSILAAVEYVKNAKDGRDPDTPIFRVHPGAEPPTFTCHFLGWQEIDPSSDPYAKMLSKSGAHHGGGADSKQPERVGAGNVGYDYSKKFPLSELQKSTPAGCDPQAKERHLSDDEFKSALGVPRGEFDTMPKWKQQATKKKAGIF